MLSQRAHEDLLGIPRDVDVELRLNHDELLNNLVRGNCRNGTDTTRYGLGGSSHGAL